MKLSLKWLSDYVDVPDSLEALCDKLDLTGTGVEGIEKTGDAFDKVVTGQILEKEKHPDSDHMWVCKVDVGRFNTNDSGDPEPLQIVCGAQNFNAKDHVVVALVGAVLPGDIKIKKSKLRGVVSCGMNCSERELGLGNNHDGIMILEEDAPVGIPFSEYLGKADTVLDLEITPNRPDSLSVLGLAREIGAIYQIPVKNPLTEDASKLAQYEQGEDVSKSVSVEITDSTRCARYSARLIENVKIGPSPKWLAERVMALGARSINNVVDVTNYIMFLYGQPLHAFDFDELAADSDATSNKAAVIIRPAEDDEKITTLDGEDRILTSDMTVIATPKRAVALAGVMGGLNSEVTDNTTNVLLETATFNRAHASRTSRALGLISEASLRYERGVDAASIEEISAAAAALLAEVSGGTVRPGIVDEYPVKAQGNNLQFRTSRFKKFVGVNISDSFVKDVLQRLGCEVSDLEDDVLSVKTPTYRPDLEREIDLYEEVLRLWGMDRIESTLPSSPLRVGVQENDQLILRKVDRTLRASGLSETMTYSFVPSDDDEKTHMIDTFTGVPVTLMNPLSAEQSQMRRSVVPGLLRSVAYNQNHGTSNIQLYEIGSVFFGVEGHARPKERVKVAGVLAGAMDDAQWNVKYPEFDFFDGKGVLENIARELCIPKVRFKAATEQDCPQLQPGRGAVMLSGGTELGWVGEIHPLVAEAFQTKAPIVAFELDLDALTKVSRFAREYSDVPAFPPVEIDQAFIVDESVTAEKMQQVMTSAGGALLESVRLFDVYRDDKRVGAGKKSMAFSLTYRAPDRTLTSEKVEKTHSKLVKKVCGATGAEVRA